MKKKVLVTGATGFIGSHLVNRLQNLHFEIHCLIRKGSDLNRLTSLSEYTTLHPVDLTDYDNLSKITNKIKPEYVFHCAAVGMRNAVEEDVYNTFSSNVLGTMNLIRSLEKIPYKLFINSGSSAEYGPKDKSMSEKDLPNPESMYAVSKLSSTLFCSRYAIMAKKPIVTLRIFSPYGPFDDSKRFIPTVIKGILQNKTIQIGNPSAVRDYIYIDDLIDAYFACISNRTKISGSIINVGSGKQYSIGEVTNTLQKILPQAKFKMKKKIRKFESPIWRADISNAKQLLGWKPRTTIKKGLLKTVNFYSTTIW